MATLKEIRNRLKSIRSTQQLTKAMKMVAASKLRRAQERTLNARPYGDKLNELLSSLSHGIDTTEFPLLARREDVKNVLAIVIASDRGLCGAFNTNVLKFAKQAIDEEYGMYLSSRNLKVITVGRKSDDFFMKRGYPVDKRYAGIFGKLRYETAEEIASIASARYLARECDKVVLFYNKFKNVLAPELRKDVLLPIAVGTFGKDSWKSEHIYEPSPKVIVEALLPKHLAMHVWRSLMESSAAEEASRMTAMDSATENAKDLIRTLGISYNRARQAAITKELIEIVSGANALEN